MPAQVGRQPGHGDDVRTGRPDRRGSEQTLRALVEAWARAWNAKDANAYLSFYGAEFEPEDGMPRDQWAAQRRARIVGAEPVTLSDLELQVEGERALARFVQTFRSPGQREQGPRTLVLAHDGERWTIVGERRGH